MLKVINARKWISRAALVLTFAIGSVGYLLYKDYRLHIRPSEHWPLFIELYELSGCSLTLSGVVDPVAIGVFDYMAFSICANIRKSQSEWEVWRTIDMRVPMDTLVQLNARRASFSEEERASNKAAFDGYFRREEAMKGALWKEGQVWSRLRELEDVGFVFQVHTRETL